MQKINVRELSRKKCQASVILPDAKATEKLGYDFSATLFLDWENANAISHRTRFALIATPGTGKTALFKGLYSRLDTPLTLEKRQDHLRHGRFGGKSITQKWFHSTEMGDVCHVDTGFGQEFWRILKPYREGLLANNKYGLDIVENAETDDRHAQFDCAIWLEKRYVEDKTGLYLNNRTIRQAYIYATDEFAKRAAFQDFLKSQSLVDPIGDIREDLNGLDI